MSDFNERIIAEFRENGGTITSTRHGRHLVLMHHVGAKSGIERIAPVFAVPVDDGWLVMASKAGAPEHPAWYHNLMAHPDIEVEYPGDDGAVATTDVHVSEVPEEEWEEAFALFPPGFSEYRAKTTRHMPILRLSRR